jgi:hypothetical protein
MLIVKQTIDMPNNSRPGLHRYLGYRKAERIETTNQSD